MSCGCSNGSDYGTQKYYYGYGNNKADEPTASAVLMNAAYSAAIGAAEGYLLYGYDSRLLVPGLGSVSAPVGFGVHTLLSSTIAQYVDPMLQSADTPPKPWIPVQQVPVLGGVAQVGTHMLAGNTGVSSVNAFLVGSTSEFIRKTILGN
jgi:hypothetical protein